MVKTSILTPQNIIKVVVWMVPILFAMGIFYGQTRDAMAKVNMVQNDLHTHEKVAGHPVAKEKIKELEEHSSELVREQRIMRKQIRKASENISAICQATGASCR